MGKIQIGLYVNKISKSKGYGHFYGRVQPYSTIDVHDLNEHIALDSKVERSVVNEVIDALVRQITEMVLNGHNIRLPYIGMLQSYIKGKTADTPADYNPSEHVKKIGVRYRQSQEIREALKATKLELASTGYTEAFRRASATAEDDKAEYNAWAQEQADMYHCVMPSWDNVHTTTTQMDIKPKEEDPEP